MLQRSDGQTECGATVRVWHGNLCSSACRQDEQVGFSHCSFPMFFSNGDCDLLVEGSASVSTQHKTMASSSLVASLVASLLWAEMKIWMEAPRPPIVDAYTQIEPLRT